MLAVVVAVIHSRWRVKIGPCFVVVHSASKMTQKAGRGEGGNSNDKSLTTLPPELFDRCSAVILWPCQTSFENEFWRWESLLVL